MNSTCQTGWHLALHGLHGDAPPGHWLEVAGRPLRAWGGEARELAAPLPTTFDDAAARLERLSGVFFEPDGSFTRVSASGPRDWRLEGVLYDGGPRLMYVELKGSCSPAAWEELLAALGADAGPLLVQFVRQAIFATPADFAAWAFGAAADS